MSRYFRVPPKLMRFNVFYLGSSGHTRLGRVNLSAEEGFDPLKLKSHEHIADIENAAHLLKKRYERREACGVDLPKCLLRVEISE